MRVIDIEAIRIKLASPEEILSWSHGEVTKPETINYRTQRAEKEGLFDEKIFGPEKDYECYCGKYRRIRYKGVICDRCGVEVTKSSVRRERMGHIKLYSPVSHIWFLRGVPSRIGMVLDLAGLQLEKVIYFAAYIITDVFEEPKKKIVEEIEKEYRQKVKTAKNQAKEAGEETKPENDLLSKLKAARDKAKEEVLGLKPLKILSEVEFHELSLKYGECFEAGTGAETLRKICAGLNLEKETAGIKKELDAFEKTPEAEATKKKETVVPLPVPKPATETSGEIKKKLLRRLRLFQGMFKAGIRPEWMFLTVLPVLPPDLRPMVQLDGGRYASSDLNDLYRRVINRNNRLKYLLEINAPEVIVRNEKRMLQEAVDALIDNGMRKGTMTQATTGGRRLLKSLTDILKGKQGRFRQNLLGKRVDYSGRSVIVVGPALKLDECGLPKKMALELFKPFVIKKILEKELAYNVRGAARLIEQETDEIWAILEEIVKDKLVLLNRAPTLHRLGIQAFKPLLIEGEAIQLHPLVCRSFNADFDGDQMAVHLPLSEEAQREAREIMLSSSNLLKPATGLPAMTPSQDIVLGCYWLTKTIKGGPGKGKIFASEEDAILAHDFGVVDLKVLIKVRKNNALLETSVGRLIFNQALPKGFAFCNEIMNSKMLERMFRQIIDKYDNETAKEILDRVKNLGFEYATLSGVSWGMDDLIVPPEKGKIIEEAEKAVEQVNDYYRKGLLTKGEKNDKVIEVWQKTKAEIEKLVPKTLDETGSVFQIIDSGARGSWSQPVQMAGMKGLVINPAGKIIELPVKSSFKEGFSVLEYFISTHGARKGTADTALRTSAAGYLTRRLIDVAHEVVVIEKDCHDDKGIEIDQKEVEKIGQNLVFKIVGQVAAEDICLPKDEGEKVIVKAGEVIGWEKAEIIAAKDIGKIRRRSVLSCKTIGGVCQKCYGWDLGRNQLIKIGEAVGIVAAQAIGEPGTQLTMRTFHTGGVAGGGDITLGLPRVQEIFEAREPDGKAEILRADGKVLEVTEEGIIKIQLNSSAENQPSRGRRKTKTSETKLPDVIEYKAPAKVAIWVKPGEEVKRGQQLWEGNLDLKEVFRLEGIEGTQNYIVSEVQKIYSSQGVNIHDKHIEVIIRQMFSRVRIKDSGQSLFTVGEIIEKEKFIEANVFLKKEGKKPATAAPILLGISKVALTTDSFLSAASFQETSRVLIRAVLDGKEDKLRGLKENVIIGKLIPCGTGFRKKRKGV
ncbi:MAG: DNA-directed RNA polymerase subunit beta' [Candidatus Nealsonbacteria bacterium CG08_land_8_20_14_0_20_43_11]|uniref:DNA-directed RNA polymerase subunit beta' n=1 Tax=Candidatus Nealsonbacteria bacterium CG08_land_8_20_14_0_20_43_11 TaxID=1974706 RepID=A0A2M6T0U9_9BACT|nr:MAG: DNA-directed RNA polymerase subunit beta' [Candidatus Nealsonbacteria bacterium CG08_land_8_20_14_0_20_43_11]